MAAEAIQGRPGRLAAAWARVDAGRREAIGEAARTFLLSRAMVLLVAVAAAATLELSPNAARFDAPGLTHPLGAVGDALLSPLARWDAAWYLSIAHDGYGATGLDAAFFPLYPLLVHLAGGGPAATPASLLVASYVLSLSAFAAALYLLQRLVALELGPRVARATLLLLAFFPASLWFGAPYSESLFLLVSVGAFYAARTGHWAAAGALAAAASATRSAGIVLVLPLALLWLSGPRRPRELAWLGLAPLGIAAYSAYLGATQDSAFAWIDLQRAWYREFAGPFAGAWDGALAAWSAFGRLGPGVEGELARRALLEFPFLVFALVATAGAWRRLPRAYGAYALAALALPLSFPVETEPLMSLPRFVAVLFPLFMWLGLVCEERRLTDGALAMSGVGLGLLTSWFATWVWVA